MIKSITMAALSHKSIIHSILDYYKKRTQASACVWLLTFQFGWLLSSRNKGSKITDMRQRTTKALKTI